MPQKVVAIIPAYNEQEALEQAFETIAQSMPDHVQHVILVNDGSTDGTQRVMEKIANQRQNITVLSHPSNLGKADAFLTGLKAAKKMKATHVVMMDADVHHASPNAIEKMLQPLLGASKIKRSVALRDEGIPENVSYQYSGNQAFRIGSFNAYFAQNRRWKNLLEGARFGLEEALDHLFPNTATHFAHVKFKQRPPFGKELAFFHHTRSDKPYRAAIDRQVSEIHAVRDQIKARNEQLVRALQARARKRTRN